MSASGEGAYWFCLKHHEVEGRDGCRNADRLGPYETAAEAGRALEKVQERNEAWVEEDERWDEGRGEGSPPGAGGP